MPIYEIFGLVHYHHTFIRYPSLPPRLATTDPIIAEHLVSRTGNPCPTVYDDITCYPIDINLFDKASDKDPNLYPAYDKVDERFLLYGLAF